MQRLPHEGNPHYTKLSMCWRPFIDELRLTQNESNRRPTSGTEVTIESSSLVRTDIDVGFLHKDNSK